MTEPVWVDIVQNKQQLQKRNREQREEYIRASLALSLIPDIGAGRIRVLFNHFTSPMSLFAADWSELAVVKNINRTTARAICAFRDWGKVDELLHVTKKLRISLMTPFDSAYPARLKHIYDPPPLLWVKGHPNALSHHFIAVVGTRRPSTAGREVTIRLTRDLIRQSGVGIVSGLANGIDTLAHKTTLEEKGCTVAVLGSGIDRIYPSGNIRLAHQIIDNGGALVSEFIPGTRPDAYNFPIRNRVVSGMSLGVLVTETGKTGGSMITVHRALDQDREVFIVPHDVRNPRGEGSNEIIQKSYGKLVCRASDIIEELPEVSVKVKDTSHRSTETGSTKNPKFRPENEVEKKLCHLLSGQVFHIDDLSQTMQMPAHSLLPVLLKLELERVVVQKPGKKFTCPEW